jgi:short-subunit dehydrogenase
MNFFKNKKIWIIGASEGIGHAIYHKIQPFSAHIFLSSRNLKKLQNIKNKSNNTSVHAVDIRDYNKFKLTARKVLAQGCNALIFCAGYYKPTRFQNYNLPDQLQTLDVNLKSFLYLIDFLKKYNHCIEKIVVLASSAGYIGLPGSFAYGASKAGLVNLCECLQTELPQINIQIINCGFVKTRLTKQNKFAMPMIITAERAAEKIVENIYKDDFEITFPKTFIMFLKCLRIVPYKIYFKLISFIYLKNNSAR